MSKDSIITASNLVKVYGKGETAVRAVDGISFQIERGSFVAITGESGSGKSSLLHIIGGVDTKTEGSIIVDGHDLSNATDLELSLFRRKTVGFVFQFFNLIPVLNAEENITLPLNLDNVKPDMKYLDELLNVLGIADKRHSFPNELSGGQQQRVAIARALIAHAPIILADEPTGNLDSKNGREIIRFLKEAVERYGQTLVLITHDGSAAGQADRIIRMSDGLIAEDYLVANKS